jgi:hypothetical protein
MMGWDGNGFAWYGMVGGMGVFYFLFVLHDTLFALRLRYTIEAVHVVDSPFNVHVLVASTHSHLLTLHCLSWPVITNFFGLGSRCVALSCYGMLCGHDANMINKCGIHLQMAWFYMLFLALGSKRH